MAKFVSTSSTSCWNERSLKLRLPWTVFFNWKILHRLFVLIKTEKLPVPLDALMPLDPHPKMLVAGCIESSGRTQGTLNISQPPRGIASNILHSLQLVLVPGTNKQSLNFWHSPMILSVASLHNQARLVQHLEMDLESECEKISWRPWYPSQSFLCLMFNMSTTVSSGNMCWCWITVLNRFEVDIPRMPSQGAVDQVVIAARAAVPRWICGYFSSAFFFSVRGRGNSTLKCLYFRCLFFLVGEIIIHILKCSIYIYI